ncbi:Aminotransferase [Rhypophila sp. PSN 637]
MSTFPPPPTNKLDWSSGKILKFDQDDVHGLASALNYGQQIFECLKAFRMPPGDAGSDSIALFRPDCHGKRFRHSAEVVDMPPIPADMFQQACRAAWPSTPTGWGMYLRPLLFASGPSLVPHPTHGWIFCIYVAPLSFGALDGMPPVKALILDDFDRAAPRGTGHAKTGGNYAGSIPWIMQAKTAGFDLTLHLDCMRREMIEEFSASGFLAVRKTGTSADSDITLVVPDSPTVLPSLTSDSKRRVRYEELPYFDEVMSAGTGTGLVPVRSITRRVGPLLTSKMPNYDTTRHLHVGSDGFETIQYIQDEQQLVAQLGGIQVGKLEDKFGWCCEVLAEDAHITFNR